MKLRIASDIGLLVGGLLATLAACSSTGDSTPSPTTSTGAAGTGGQQHTGGGSPSGSGGSAATSGGAGSAGSGGGSSGGGAGGGAGGAAGSDSSGASGAGGSTVRDGGGTAGSGGSAGAGGSGGNSAGPDAGDASVEGGTARSDAGTVIMGDGGAPVRSGGCTQMRKLSNGRNTIQSGGVARTYYLQAPSNYDNMHAYRLVFTFHWNGGSANSIVNPPDADHNTDRPFYGLSDLSGDTTIYVAPDGLSQGWANTNDRDVNFTDDMLKAITDDLCIDTSRVFTTGFSFGGAISYKLACVRNEKFRAAIVYDAGPVSGNKTSECTKPIAWFQSHGLADGIFNYTSVGIPILNLFVQLNGCTAAMPPNAPTNGHTCFQFEGCSAGHPTRWCGFGSGENNTRSPGGHYPSAKDPGQTTSWIPDEAWKFITQF